MDDIRVGETTLSSFKVTLEPEEVSAATEKERITWRPEVFVQGRFSFSPVRSAEPISITDFHLTRLEIGWSGRLTTHFGMGFEVKIHDAIYGEPRSMLNDAFVEYEFSNHLKIRLGQFVKPFGFDVQQSTSLRESPERAMFAGYFFPAKRDRGIMVSGDLKDYGNRALKNVSYSFGLFSGNLFFDKTRSEPNFVARRARRSSALI